MDLAMKYMITVRTGNTTGAAVNETIRMSIDGDQKRIEPFILADHAKTQGEEHFRKGKTDHFEIKHDDIGKVRYQFDVSIHRENISIE
jgi:hypothetical protein